jgi:hypothetical protein
LLAAATVAIFLVSMERIPIKRQPADSHAFASAELLASTTAGPE